VSQNTFTFFVITRSNVGPILIFGDIAAKKICTQVTYSFHTGVRILQNRKTRDVLYAFNAAASSCRRASVMQLFSNVCLVPQSPSFIMKFLNTFICSITSNNVQFLKSKFDFRS